MGQFEAGTLWDTCPVVPLWDSPGTLRGPRQSHRFVRGFGGVLGTGVSSKAVIAFWSGGVPPLVLIFRGGCGRFRW